MENECGCGFWMGCGEEGVVEEYDTIRHLYLALTAYNLPAYQIGYWNRNRTHTIIIVFSLLASSDSGVCRPPSSFNPPIHASSTSRVYVRSPIPGPKDRKNRDLWLSTYDTALSSYFHSTPGLPELRPKAIKHY